MSWRSNSASSNAIELIVCFRCAVCVLFVSLCVCVCVCLAGGDCLLLFFFFFFLLLFAFFWVDLCKVENFLVLLQIVYGESRSTKKGKSPRVDNMLWIHHGRLVAALLALVVLPVLLAVIVIIVAICPIPVLCSTQPCLIS